MPPEFLALFELGLIGVLVFGATAASLYNRAKERRAQEAAQRTGPSATTADGRPAAGKTGGGLRGAPQSRFVATTRRFPPPSAPRRGS